MLTIIGGLPNQNPAKNFLLYDNLIQWISTCTHLHVTLIIARQRMTTVTLVHVCQGLFTDSWRLKGPDGMIMQRCWNPCVSYEPITSLWYINVNSWSIQASTIAINRCHATCICPVGFCWEVHSCWIVLIYLQFIAPDDLPYFITRATNVTASNDISKHFKAAEVELAFVDTPHRLNQEIFFIRIHLDDLIANIERRSRSVQICRLQ